MTHFLPVSHLLPFRPAPPPLPSLPQLSIIAFGMGMAAVSAVESATMRLVKPLQV